MKAIRFAIWSVARCRSVGAAGASSWSPISRSIDTRCTIGSRAVLYAVEALHHMPDETLLLSDRKSGRKCRALHRACAVRPLLLASRAVPCGRSLTVAPVSQELDQPVLTSYPPCPAPPSSARRKRVVSDTSCRRLQRDNSPNETLSAVAVACRAIEIEIRFVRDIIMT